MGKMTFSRLNIWAKPLKFVRNMAPSGQKQPFQEIETDQDTLVQMKNVYNISKTTDIDVERQASTESEAASPPAWPHARSLSTGNGFL